MLRDNPIGNDLNDLGRSLRGNRFEEIEQTRGDQWDIVLMQFDQALENMEVVLGDFVQIFTTTSTRVIY